MRNKLGAGLALFITAEQIELTTLSIVEFFFPTLFVFVIFQSTPLFVAS